MCELVLECTVYSIIIHVARGWHQSIGMSYTEVRTREGMPYGGVPHDTILMKLEATDPDAVDAVRGYDPDNSVSEAYRNHARNEIIDWSPDVPGVESDGPRRNPSASRMVINRHYNGNRGSYSDEAARHPEMFIGFTGNDPRGTTNDPRFDQVRGHMTSRAANLTARMGDNNSDHVAERPWTNQSIGYGMQEVKRRVKRSTHVFTVSKEGRPAGRNTTVSGNGVAPRADPEDDRDLMSTAAGGRLAAAESAARQAPSGVAPRKVDAILQDMDMDYGEHSDGRLSHGPSRAPGGPGRQTGDHDWAAVHSTLDTRSAQLGSMLAAATRATKDRRADTDQDQAADMHITALGAGHVLQNTAGAAGRSQPIDHDWAQVISSQLRHSTKAPAGAGNVWLSHATTNQSALPTYSQIVRAVRSGARDDIRKAAQAAQATFRTDSSANHTNKNMAMSGRVQDGRVIGGHSTASWADAMQTQMGRTAMPMATPNPENRALLGDEAENTFGLDTNGYQSTSTALGTKTLRGDRVSRELLTSVLAN